MDEAVGRALKHCKIIRQLIAALDSALMQDRGSPLAACVGLRYLVTYGAWKEMELGLDLVIWVELTL